MSEDQFLEPLREKARVLRYEPKDDAIWTRLPARIRARVNAQPLTASQLLASWFRPIAASLTALALVASIGLAWYERPDAPATETIGAAGVDIQMDGDSYRVGD